MIALLLAAAALAQSAPEALPLAEAAETLVNTGDGQEASTAVRLVVLLTGMSLLPGLLLVMTPFTRFIIVFSLLRQALGLQQSPPNQVLIGLSLALSLLVMQPTVDQVNADAVTPYLDGQITTSQAFDAAKGPMRAHMVRHIDRDDLRTGLQLARLERPSSLDEVPTTVLITSYVLSELEAAFVIAVKVYLPFLVVDLVVASVLLGMGMMMLPPVVVSLPFKLLVFVLMDGWALLVSGMVGGLT